MQPPNFIEKHKRIIFIMLFLLITVSFGFLYGLLNTQPEEDTSLNNKQASYKTLAPGTSSKKDVIDKLGEPEEESQTNETRRLEYISSTLAHDHEIVLENERVVFIKEVITQKDNKTAEEIIDQYGNTNKILYGPHSSAGFDLYVYPENGIAYVGNEEGILIEIWYFEPMSFDEFKTKWAENYTDILIPQQ